MKLVMPAKKHNHTPPDNVKPPFLLSKVPTKPSARNLLLGGAIFHVCSAHDLHFHFLVCVLFFLKKVKGVSY